MPTPAPIDLNEIAAAAVALLDKRGSKLEALRREAEAQREVEAQRQAAQALEARKAQRAADQVTLRLMDVHLKELTTAIEVKTEQWKKLPREISELGQRHSRLLAERTTLRQKLGN
jgi:hypothetical protein